ncbi:putative CDPK-related kinase 3 [Cocos nucifera]|uniref:Putative CDPK-related kinase 3 n=1 Tax=Cocos nucifera TaxID=13894 RepID=A0A8K0IG06_COCNU|nr:putative CDPK-related kinase 3 [Cocos nucifera]
MGQCYAKKIPVVEDDLQHQPPPPPAANGGGDSVGAANPSPSPRRGGTTPARSSAASPWLSPFRHSSSASPLPVGVSASPARATPRRFLRLPFPPPSPAKHIKASLVKRQGARKPREGSIPEEGGGGGTGDPQVERPLDKTFGYGKNFGAKYELGKEVGRGHFGHTCSARVKKGDIKGQLVAVKIISKAKMTTAISIEDVRREVKILKALSGHKNLVKFHDACVVHRDLKPENFLFTTRDENALMKIIDFGLSDFNRPDERLNDIVGSAYYVAPEVLHRSYSMEADIWSIGVITYILLCGSRPFWARTESGIFRAVLRADPNFDDSPWPAVSREAKDFVKRLLNKDYRKRMTAVQALTHPWLHDEQQQVPLDILIYKLVKSYLRASPFKRAALKFVARFKSSSLALLAFSVSTRIMTIVSFLEVKVDINSL